MLLAQAATNTSGQALDTLRDAIELSENTVQSWNALWTTLLRYSESGLWLALVRLGLILAGISVLYLAATEGKDAIENRSWSKLVSMFIWPIVIVIFLGGNGAVLAESVKFIRSVGYAQVQGVTEIQMGEFTFRTAISDITISSAAKEQLETLYSECLGERGQELIDCWNDKKEQALAIIDEAEAQNGGPLETLRRFGQSLLDATNIKSIVSGEFGVEVFRNIALPIIRFILRAIQWAFVNILEAALLLTAAFAPIAMGLSLLPLQGRPIFAWLTGFISLFGLQLGYNIVVGLTAVVIVNSNAELITDVAFLFFLAVFAPILATLIAGGGGIALYRGISSSTKQLTDILSSAVLAASKFI
ncbi:MAG: hypothetical protein AB4426_19605 [Xenococcaceae cyanobacterium]